jgi:hypothetical protein
MRGIALVTTLAMSIGTAAVASPVRVADRDDVRVQIRTDAGWTHDRYDRYNDSRWSRDFRGRWRTLASAYTTQGQRQFIHVSGGRLSKLRIEGVRGAPVIQKVAIEFGDGSSQAIDLNMRLPRGAGEVIDLNGSTRKVNRIIVYADPQTRGSYSVYGA